MSVFEGSNKSSQRSFPPIVTAAAWGIHDANTGEILWEKNAEEQREMASLTKIMTCFLSSHLLTRFNEDPETLTFHVNQISARVCGTHSGLRENDTVRVIDLLYGLMLPSGNDCALALAFGFGNMLIKAKKSKLIDKLPVNPVTVFVKEMNKLALKLGLKNTSFTNPHGLSEKSNKSTVRDLGKLGFNAIGMPLIEKIVSTQSYDAHIMNGKGHIRTLSWKNTNKLLEKGFGGLKTGTTPNAGMCLSCVLRDGEEGVIVTLLNSKTEEHRWGESEKLARWALNTILSVKGQMNGLSDTVKAKITSKLIADFSKRI
jgi:D-alanyl-D-alanine carboxypeptidase